MGLDAYIIPFEKVITLDIIENDVNLIVEREDDFTTIRLASNPQSAFGLYSSDVEFVNYARVWKGSYEILRYIGETYDSLIGADGYLSDAGYRMVMENRFCENDEENRAFTIGMLAGEMLDYSDYYGWSDEFKQRLEKAVAEVKPIYEKVIERVKAYFAECEEEARKAPNFEKKTMPFNTQDDDLPF